MEPAGNLKGKFAGWVGACWEFVGELLKPGQVRSSQVPASLITEPDLLCSLLA